MGSWFDDFLPHRDPIEWAAPAAFPAGVATRCLFFQPAGHGLEVALAETAAKPSTGVLRRAWRERHNQRPSPVLLLVGYPERSGYAMSVCGPVGSHPPVVHGIDIAQAEKLADAALSEPDRHAATRCLIANVPQLDQPLPGLRNVGLLATHELLNGATVRQDWGTATRTGRSVIRAALTGSRSGVTGCARGVGLVKALGFGVGSLATGVSVLESGAEREAVAVFCHDDEPFDAPSGRFRGVTPVSSALAQADKAGIGWVVLTRSSEIRLYSAERNVGVGRRGRAETFVEANLSLLSDDTAGYLALLFSAEALAPDGALGELLESSKRYASDLAARLRERVYERAVPALAKAVSARLDGTPTGEALRSAYQQVMIILFRLLFTAYAEDKDLLPYRTNSRYAERSLVSLARQRIQERSSGQPADPDSCRLWERVNKIWDSINTGNPRWGVPVYDGGLFTKDAEVNPHGAALAEIALTDTEFGPALDAVLINENPEGEGPVDFRSLSVLEFGTIYEGLLESELSAARTDLTVRKEQNIERYVPAGPGDEVAVTEGEVYLHNRSGTRKSTGSYFTKPFAVEHLLDEALEPALSAHIDRLDRLRADTGTNAVYEAFFDFRCADIAMGSGHFLVAAIDRIEAKLSGYLASRPVPRVADELNRIRRAAHDALGETGAGVEIETSSLLRRQIARHCVYGIDLQPAAAELARLALWVHTFVPGLPLSFLDHNLVCGNSLTGVCSLADGISAVGAGSEQSGLFLNGLLEHLADTEPALRRLARTSDATKHEIDQARAAHEEARQATEVPEALFGLVCAARAGNVDLSGLASEGALSGDTEILRARSRDETQNAVTRFVPVHYPTAFPEVFLRDNPGFDCVVGNPPWDEIVADKKIWWGRHLPGVQGRPVGEMNAAINEMRRSRPDLENEFRQDRAETEQLRRVLRATYPQLGAGKTDLYKAFCWRKWQLLRVGGTAGVVLPRSALQAKGSEAWRKHVLTEGEFLNVTTLLNRNGWVFDGVTDNYSIVLLAARKLGTPGRELVIRGPYANRRDYLAGRKSEPQAVQVEEFLNWSNDGSFPQIPDRPGSLTLFRKLRRHPRFDAQPITGGGFRPVQGDSNATTDKHRFILGGGSVRFASSTPPRTNTASSSAGGVPTGRGTSFHSRQTPPHPQQHRERERERERRFGLSTKARRSICGNRTQAPITRR